MSRLVKTSCEDYNESIKLLPVIQTSQVLDYLKRELESVLWPILLTHCVEVNAE